MSSHRNNTYIIDTSVLIDDPDVLIKLRDSKIVLPAAVIKEIDGIKKYADPNEPRAKAVRRVARVLDGLSSRQDITKGAITSAGSTISIYHRYVFIDDLASQGDNRIIGAALELTKGTSDNVILLSTDRNLRTVARSYGIYAENYPFSSDPHNRGTKMRPHDTESTVARQMRSSAEQSTESTQVQHQFRFEMRNYIFISCLILIGIDSIAVLVGIIVMVSVVAVGMYCLIPLVEAFEKYPKSRGSFFR